MINKIKELYIEKGLSLTKTAKILKMPTSSLHYKMDKLSIPRRSNKINSLGNKRRSSFGCKDFTIRNGYRVIKVKDKYVLEHRYIWEQKNGKIPEGFILHHRDENKHNNDINNLELTTRPEHCKYHKPFLMGGD